MPEEHSQTLNLDDLLLTVHEGLQDYLFLAPVPPFEKGQYVTNIAGIKLGLGARYYLLKALKKVRKVYPDGNVPNWAFEVADLPNLDQPLTRRRGWLKQSEFFENFEKDSLVEVLSTFPKHPSSYQQDISRFSPEKWDDFTHAVRGKIGIVVATPIPEDGPQIGGRRFTVQFTEPVLDEKLFNFFAEDLEVVLFSAEESWLTKAYKIRDIGNNSLRRTKNQVSTGGANLQGETWEISQEVEPPGSINTKTPPTQESMPLK